VRQDERTRRRHAPSHAKDPVRIESRLARRDANGLPLLGRDVGRDGERERPADDLVRASLDHRERARGVDHDERRDRECGRGDQVGSIAGLQARLAAVEPQFSALVRRIRDRNEWDDVFVDALCTPPVSFTLGSVVAHILTVGVVRRQSVIDALRELGVRDVEARDPIEWERALAARE